MMIGAETEAVKDAEVVTGVTSELVVNLFVVIMFDLWVSQ
jgi:hypothetical protein